MRRHLTMTALLLAGVLAGCAPEGTPQTLLLTGNSAVSAQGGCKISASASGESRSVGTLDLLFANNYMMFPMVSNRLPMASAVSELGVTEGAVESHGVILTGARLWFEIDGLLGQWDGGETILPDEIFSPTSGYMDPGDGMVVQVEALPASVVNLLDGDMVFDSIYTGGYLIVHIVVEGRKIDGTKVRSNEFVYPINVCRGCRMYWPIEPTTCCDTVVTEAVVCFPGQDEAIPCDIGCSVVGFNERVAAKMAMIQQQTTNLSVLEEGGGTDGDVLENDIEEEDVL